MKLIDLYYICFIIPLIIIDFLIFLIIFSKHYRHSEFRLNF